MLPATCAQKHNYMAMNSRCHRQQTVVSGQAGLGTPLGEDCPPVGKEASEHVPGEWTAPPGLRRAGVGGRPAPVVVGPVPDSGPPAGLGPTAPARLRHGLFDAGKADIGTG